MTDLLTVSFTAARVFDSQAEAVATSVLMTAVPLADRYITGGARGGDSFIGRWLFDHRPEAKHHVIVPANRSQVDYWWHRIHSIEQVLLTSAGGLYRDHRGAIVEIIFMPPGTTYEDRNARLVKSATMVFGFPAYPEINPQAARSGTWQAIRMARKAGKLSQWHCVKPPFRGLIEKYPSAFLPRDIAATQESESRP